MQKSNKISREIIDIVIDASIKIGQIGVVCLLLTVLARLGY